jgi:signal transduction histidine kinase/CheY-like chemotaxis protein
VGAALGNTRLRTKFLLSLLAISAGLTAATLFIVSYSVKKQVRTGLQDDLRNSVNTYQSFERQRQDTLTRSAQLLANLPIVRALMTTRDAATIQDGSADIWRLSGSDLFVLADRTGDVLGFQSATKDVRHETTQDLLRASLEKGEAKDWWFGDGHLYEVWIQTIYFGAPSEDSTIGFLVVGHEIDNTAARDFSTIASSEVAFGYGGNVVASTLMPAQQIELGRQMHDSPQRPTGVAQEIQIGNERYLITTVALSPPSGPPVSLSILKSFDQATAFLSGLNHVLLGLGLLSVLAGSLLVFLISHTFTRPLQTLVNAVRALAEGNFNYPVASAGKDEVAEVTAAFTRMRTTLEQNQSEQKRLEDRLRQAHKMEAVGRLAGGVAHDFNNLLTIIKGHGDILLDGGASEAQRHNVEQIQRAAGRAVSMTRQLLAFSRMQVLQPRILDLNVVVGEMGKMLPRLIGEDIEYTFVPGEKLAAVKADPGQIEQVVLNLVVNSRDAMPHGGKITAKTRNVAVDEFTAASRAPMTPGRYVLLSVSDTGEGIDESAKAHIFEPFFTTKGVGKGTGLGLATVYGVVKQSGGFIWLESAIGKGTTFEIYLPEAYEKVSEAHAESKPSAMQRGSETILVVEDEPGVRELACEFLKARGYSVLQAKDGVEALELAARHAGAIHLVLSDIVMPRMGGLELAKRLKELRGDVKILFMSGYTEYASGGVADGSSQISRIQKPFSAASLACSVRDALAETPAQEPSDAAARCVT